MLCPKCQYRNPDENHFCGQCGCDLARSAPTIYPREGYDEADLPPVSDVEPELPRFRRDVPPLAQSEYGPPLEAPEVTEDGKESAVTQLSPASAQNPAAPPSTQSDLRTFGNTNSILFTVPQKGSPGDEPVRETPVYASDEPKRSQGIHGPSFLGLAEGGDPDFLDDIDEPRSHARRNWFLFAVALLAVLAFAEWRNIRQGGLKFAGAMKLSLPNKKGEQPKTVENAATETHSETGPANNGKPEITVNPINSGTADQKQATNASTDNNGNASQPPANASAPAQQGTGSEAGRQNGAQQAGAAGSAHSPDTSNPADGNQSTSGQKSATGQAKNTATDISTDTEDSSADDAGETTGASDEAKPRLPAKSARHSTRTAESKASPGAEELLRANTAGSPETAAKWLWASTSKGNLDAPVRLADMYANGRGVSKDCEQATVLLRSSARRGNPRAAARLGMYYATGLCVQQDRQQAWHWLSIAHQRDPNSDWITQYRQRLWSEMSPEERARAGNGPNSANASE